MMEALSSPKTSVLKRATRRNFPQDGILHSHRRENLKSYITERESVAETSCFPVSRIPGDVWGPQSQWFWPNKDNDFLPELWKSVEGTDVFSFVYRDVLEPGTNYFYRETNYTSITNFSV
jgi:hypothetical protein